MTTPDLIPEPKPGCKALPSTTELCSAKSTLRLNQIDRVRENGIGDHVSLPQLVVCGDQSSGKSSVLQGITGIPFPRKDGLCTRFATEIILRHDSTSERICATIIPCDARSPEEKDKLRQYRKELRDFTDLPVLIEEAAQLMQLRGAEGIAEGPSFSADALRIEVIGMTGLHLTVVDLPGLISVSNDDQDREDVEVVSNLVDTYLESSRTIILAVVQAPNDIQNQIIIQKARKFDPDGQRTVGIITKADLINRGTEGKISRLAKNNDDTKLKLGFFLLKNPTPMELDASITADERKRKELAYFAASPWKEQHLDPYRIGIDALSAFLQGLLDAHIERELPKVRSEISVLLAQTQQQLESIGEERSTVTHLRAFLTSLSLKFMGLAQAALDGNYLELEPDLTTKDVPLDASCRLRAQVHVLNGSFSDRMRRHGQKRRIGDGSSAQVKCEEDQPASSEGECEPEDRKFNGWIREVYMRTRGRELPGNYNHHLLAELFTEQSSPWESIASEHVAEVNVLVERFINKLLNHCVVEEEVRVKLREFLGDRMEHCAHEAERELANILADERRQPITYNSEYVDNIQKSRQSSMGSSIQVMMGKIISEDWGGTVHLDDGNNEDHQRLFASLMKHTVVDMEAQACEEARVGLEAYYKVALRTFVDNVCRQVVERHVLAQLPHVFSPKVVIEFSDEDLMRIASEPHAQRERRARLVKLAEGLRDSLRELRR